MKIVKFIVIYSMTLLLASCVQHAMPPFATTPHWTLDGNVATSSVHGMAIDFGGGNTFPITNASDGEYELNFISSPEQFAHYDIVCQNYISSAIRQIPLLIDSIEFVLADRYITFTPNVTKGWMPDLVRQADGSEWVVEANPRSSTIQPHDEIWRNYIFDNHRHRIIVVDRLVKNGRHIGIAYILQSEDKHVPFTSTYHYDVTHRRNIQPVGEAMRALLDITIAASQSHFTPRSYAEYVQAADSCFMAGDYAGASRLFDHAFAVSHDIPGQHLYNAACAAAQAGLNDVAFRRLNARFENEPNWYVDDPNVDTDLASLHSDLRWKAYVDTIIARRDRIEAGYDKPLRAQLQAIAQRDQDIRHEFLNAYRATPRNQTLIDSLARQMQRIDSVNQAEICHILDTRGCVGSDLVGNASSVFWLVIQHAPVELQRRYFPLFVQAAQRGDLALENVAMMDDRIAMFEGRPQRYGTQIVDGKLYQLLDPAKVDLWRHEMGMQPLADYLRQMGVQN